MSDEGLVNLLMLAFEAGRNADPDGFGVSRDFCSSMVDALNEGYAITPADRHGPLMRRLREYQKSRPQQPRQP